MTLEVLGMQVKHGRNSMPDACHLQSFRPAIRSRFARPSVAESSQSVSSVQNPARATKSREAADNLGTSQPCNPLKWEDIHSHIAPPAVANLATADPMHAVCCYYVCCTQQPSSGDAWTPIRRLIRNPSCS